MTTYTHYVNDKFYPEAVPPVRNIGWQTKPEGGLWASRKGDTFGWKEWCEENHFYVSRPRHSFRFTLPKGRILCVAFSELPVQNLPAVEG